MLRSIAITGETVPAFLGKRRLSRISWFQVVGSSVIIDAELPAR